MTEYAVLLPGDESVWESRPPRSGPRPTPAHEEFSKALEARGHKITGGAELTHSRPPGARRSDDGTRP